MHIGIGLPNQVRNVTASAIPRWVADSERAGFATPASAAPQYDGTRLHGGEASLAGSGPLR